MISFSRCSMSGVFFDGGPSAARTPHTTIMGILTEFAVEIDPSLSHGFWIDARKFSHLLRPATPENFGEQPRDPSSLLLIKSPKHQW
jgi:hypothetical protein